MAVSADRKKEFFNACHAHLVEHGSKQWKLLLSKFPDVKEATAWRWIADAKEQSIPMQQLDAATVAALNQPISDREIEAAEMGKLGITRHLPAAPSPLYLSRNGGQGLEQLDFMTEIPKLFKDAMMLRASAVTIDKDGVEKIRNPMSFDRSIVRRADILEGSIRALQEVWDLQQQQEFFTAIIEEIGKVSPSVQKAIMERLAALNSRIGMTAARF